MHVLYTHAYVLPHPQNRKNASHRDEETQPRRAEPVPLKGQGGALESRKTRYKEAGSGPQEAQRTETLPQLGIPRPGVWGAMAGSSRTQDFDKLTAVWEGKGLSKSCPGSHGPHSLTGMRSKQDPRPPARPKTQPRR